MFRLWVDAKEKVYYDDGMEILKTLLLGVIQGVTEWLPVSSTGHLILFDALFPLHVSEQCRNLMMVLIQLGSILAVIILYWHTLNPFSPRMSKGERRSCWSLWTKVVVASVPVAIIGFLLDDFIESRLYTWQVVALTLALYGAAYIVLERKRKGRDGAIHSIDGISIPRAVGMGLFEALALVPGTSRSGSTILGGMLLGVDRKTASKFSFFLAIPAMFGASLLKLVKLGFALSGYEWTLVAFGFVVSFVVSLFAIKALMRYLTSHDFQVFGWYRVILAILVVLFFSLA